MELNIWHEHNDLVAEYYNEGNYSVEILNDKSNICAIVCSGNGIYFPNTVETFTRMIIEQDRYEWENVFKSSKITKRIGKVIYIRDLFKQWYVTGINSKIDSVDKVLEFLQRETEGYEVITLGNSAGGYMAVLAGTVLNAKFIYNFSGQYSLAYDIEKNEFLKKYARDDSRNKYYDLMPLVENYKGTIFYFFPAGASDDIRQSELIQASPNVVSFAFDYDVHGKTVYGVNYQYILVSSEKTLLKISKKYTKKKMTREQFLFESAGMLEGLYELVKKLLERLFR